MAKSISVSAADSASWSDELIAPLFTSDCNSSCNFCKGDWYVLIDAAKIEVMIAPGIEDSGVSGNSH